MHHTRARTSVLEYGSHMCTLILQLDEATDAEVVSPRVPHTLAKNSHLLSYLSLWLLVPGPV